MESINKRIAALSKRHVEGYDYLLPFKNKNVGITQPVEPRILAPLFCSLLEETGELASALKIYHGFVKHKTLDEPITGEAADVYICAGALHAIYIDNFMELADLDFDKKERLDSLKAFFTICEISEKVGDIGKAIFTNNFDTGHFKLGWDMDCFRIEVMAKEIFTIYSGDEKFDDVVHKKLDKWEKVLNERIAKNAKKEYTLYLCNKCKITYSGDSHSMPMGWKHIENITSRRDIRYHLCEKCAKEVI